MRRREGSQQHVALTLQQATRFDAMPRQQMSLREWRVHVYDAVEFRGS
jgi:hypothetical protein